MRNQTRITTRKAAAALVVAAIAFAIVVAGGSTARLAAPTNSSPPTVSGTAQDGSTLTVNEGTWTGSGRRPSRTRGSAATRTAGAARRSRR